MASERPRTTPDKLSEIPQEPGVYFFMNRRGGILYIGRATNLRSRVRSYFAGDLLEKRGELVASMIPETDHVQWQTTESVLEAIVLEPYLIKKHQPPHNTKDKSDRSFVYLIITKDEFPRLLVKRQREVVEGRVNEPIRFAYGPFSSRHTLESALKIIRKIFPFHTYVRKNQSYESKSNVYQQIGWAPRDSMTKEEYNDNIRHIRMFFEGKKKRVVAELEREMLKYAERMEFEKAEKVKRQLYALQHIRDVSLISDERNQDGPSGIRIEAYDVAHIQGKHAVGVMTVLFGRDPEKNEYRKFRIKSFDGIDDNRALAELLERRFRHTEWEFPQLIVADGSVAQKRTVERFLLDNNLEKIRVVACKKNKNHRVAEILGDTNVIEKYRQAILLANSEAHRFAVEYHTYIRDRMKIRRERVKSGTVRKRKRKKNPVD